MSHAPGARTTTAESACDMRGSVVSGAGHSSASLGGIAAALTTWLPACVFHRLDATQWTKPFAAVGLTNHLEADRVAARDAVTGGVRRMSGTAVGGVLLYDLFDFSHGAMDHLPCVRTLHGIQHRGALGCAHDQQRVYLLTGVDSLDRGAGVTCRVGARVCGTRRGASRGHHRRSTGAARDRHRCGGGVLRGAWGRLTGQAFATGRSLERSGVRVGA